MYVESVSMTDFRCFEKAETTFIYPGIKKLPKEALPNVTLLIGINGAGKTSVLRGVALGVLSPIITSVGYRPYYLVRRSHGNASEDREAQIETHYCDETGILKAELYNSFFNRACIKSNSEGELFVPQNMLDVVDDDPNLPEGGIQFNQWPGNTFFLLGYGSSRRSEYLENLDSQRSRRRHPRFQRVAGLFEEFITLYPLAAWYPSLKSKTRAKEVRELLNSLLPERTQFTGECEGGEGLFNNDGVVLPFGALSDGFRSYIGLLADMLFNMHTVSPKGKLTDLAGVVMIDDIDVHLHPGWQREIVPKLAEAFPKMQFIITTHSPLVVGTVHAANIRVIEENQIREFTEQTDGRSADQILMSSYFGLSPRSEASEKKLKTIARRVADTHDPKAAVEFLKELTGKTNGKQ